MVNLAVSTAHTPHFNIQKCAKKDGKKKRKFEGGTSHSQLSQGVKNSKGMNEQLC